MAASSASVRTVERGAFESVLKSSAVCRFRHFATVFGVDPHLPAPRRERSLRPLNYRSHGVRGRDASVTDLSHRASFDSFERITPSNRGIKHLAMRGLKQTLFAQIERKRGAARSRAYQASWFFRQCALSREIILTEGPLVFGSRSAASASLKSPMLTPLK